MPEKQQKRIRILLAILAGFLVMQAVFLVPRGVEAQLPGGLVVTKKSWWDILLEKLDKAREWSWKHGAATAFKQALKTYTNRFVYEAALYVTSGAPGQKSMFRTKGWGAFWHDTTDAAKGEFIQSMTTEFGKSLMRGTCKAAPSRKCGTDRDCFIREGTSGLDEVDSFIVSDEIKRYKTHNIGICETSLKECVITEGCGEQKCLQDRVYLGPCEGEGVNQFWSAVGSDLSQFNVCRPPELGEALAITMGLTGYTEKKPEAPDCKWSEMQKNWDKAMQRRGFLEDFSKAWDPQSSALGAYIRLSGEMMGFSQTQADINKHIDTSQQMQGLHNKESAVAGYILTPGKFLSDATEKSIKDSDQSLKQFTGDIAADAINTFTNTFAARLMKQYWVKGLANLKPDRIADIFSGGVRGRAEAKKYFAELIKPEVTREASWDVLSKFQVCPEDEKYSQIDNCVIDNDFSEAIQHKKTVQEALDEGLLKKGADFGYGDYNYLTTLTVDAGYALHNIKKLRQARIVPVGWELAVERAIGVNKKAEELGLGEGRGGIYHKFNLQDIVDCFEDTDKCNKYKDDKLKVGAHNPFWHLVDPEWVLKAPAGQCGAVVYGRTQEAGGQRAEVCADLKSCIMEDESGKCLGYYDYCTKEKNIWRLEGTACESKYESCEVFTDTENKKTFAYLQDTLDISSCDQGNVGCSWYCLDYEAGPDKWACFWDGLRYSASAVPNIDQRIYLNKNARDCSSTGEGCSEFIRLEPGVNLVRNGDFSSDYDNDIVTVDGWYVSRAGVWEEAVWARVGGAVKEIEAGGAAVVYKADNKVWQSIVLEPDTYYLFSVKIKRYSKDDKPYEAKVVIRPEDDGDFVSGRFSAVGEGRGLKVDEGRTVNLWVLSGEMGDDFLEYYGTFRSNTGLTRGVLTFGGDDGLSPPQANLAAVFEEIQVREISKQEAERLGEGGWPDLSYKKYEDNNKIYLKKAPEKYRCNDEAIYAFTSKETCEYANGYWNGNSCGPSLECKNFSASCDKDDVGCQLYTSQTVQTMRIPGVVSGDDYCPENCAGYEYYRQMESNFEPAQEMVPLMAVNVKRCNGYAGCTAFTNLEAAEAGGEDKEYFSYLWQCVKPSEAGETCKTFYTWVGSETKGYELVTFNLKKDLSDKDEDGKREEPELTSSELAGLCAVADDVGKLPWPNDDKECKEFQDTLGQTYYAIYEDTVLCTEDCVRYRMADDANKTNETNCADFGGIWEEGVGGCVFRGAPDLSQRCPSQYAGCREYKGSQANAIYKVFNDDFEPGVNDGWTGGTVVTEATGVAGHSLGVGRTASKEVVFVENEDGAERKEIRLVKKGESYLLGLWAKTNDGDGRSEVEIKFSSGLSFGQVGLNTQWRPYKLGPVYIEDEVGVGETIQILAREGGLYIDNISLLQVEGTLSLVKNSGTVPEECDLPYEGAQIGCSAYKDLKETTHYLKSFTAICREEVVGCEAVINTKNSDNPFEEMFRASCRLEKDCSLTSCECKIEGDKKCEVGRGERECLFDNFRAGADERVYLVVDKNKQCRAADAGCTRVASPSGGSYEYIESYKEVIKKIDPDEFDTSLCSPMYDRCRQYEYGGGTIVFKGPGDRVCQWVKPKDERESNWYYVYKNQEGVVQYDLCKDPKDKAFGYPEVYRRDGSSVAWPQGGLAKTCEAPAAGCTKFVETLINKPVYYIENTVERGGCEKGIDVKGGCVAFKNMSRNIEGMTKTLDILGRTNVYVDKAPYAPKACIPSDCYVDNDPGTKTIKNGLENTDKCRADGGSYGAGRVACNANEIIKVEKDRVCSEWLTCRSSGAVETGNETKQVCYQIGACNKASEDQPSKCVSWVETTGGELPLSVANYQTRNVNWDGEEYSGYSLANTYPLYTLKQVPRDVSNEALGFRLAFVNETGGKAGVNMKSDGKGGVGEDDCSTNSDCLAYEECVGEVCVLRSGCRGYPAVDSPFKYTAKEDREDNVNYCAVDYKNEQYKDSFRQEQRRQMDCECTYQKVTYKESRDKFYAYQDPDIKPCAARIEDTGAACGTCDNGKGECASNADCLDYDSEGNEIKGNCQFNDTIEKRQKFVGWKGYCLEWDVKTDSCLTWWPVDYLVGDADMYNNFQSAGYNPGEDKYYCLQAEGNSGYVLTSDDSLAINDHYGKGGSVYKETLASEIFFSGGKKLSDFNKQDVESISILIEANGSETSFPGVGNIYALRKDGVEETCGTAEWCFGWCKDYKGGKCSESEATEDCKTFACFDCGEEGIFSDGDKIVFQQVDRALDKCIKEGIDKGAMVSLSAYVDESGNFTKLKYIVEDDAEVDTLKFKVRITLREPCKLVARVADSGKNTAFTSRLWKNNEIKYKVGEGVLNYTYDTEASPYGSAVAPYGSPETWDSIPSEPGNQPLYVESGNQIRAGSAYSCLGDCSKKVCIGGKNEGAECVNQASCRGGICVGAGNEKLKRGLSKAIEDIQKLFAKSMGVFRYSANQGRLTGYKCDGGVRAGEDCSGETDTTCGGSGACTYLCQAGTNPGTACNLSTCALGSTCESYEGEITVTWECTTLAGGRTGIPCFNYNPSDSATGCKGGGLCQAKCVGGKNDSQTCDYKTQNCGGAPTCKPVYESSQGVGGYVRDETKDWDKTSDLGGTKPPEVTGIEVTPKQGSKSLPVILRFYAWADDNHMPLKQVKIDWGDKETLKVGGEQSYYKNHKEKCTERDEAGRPCENGTDCYLRFGDLDKACTERPFEFSHVYYYSDDCGGEASAVKAAEECRALTGGRVNTRCCVFKPKVQVLDNWGWCNGTCQGIEGCYNGRGRESNVGECESPKDVDYPYKDYTGEIVVSP